MIIEKNIKRLFCLLATGLVILASCGRSKPLPEEGTNQPQGAGSESLAEGSTNQSQETSLESLAEEDTNQPQGSASNPLPVETSNQLQRKVKILTYNIFMKPPSIAPGNDQDRRAQLLPISLSGYDVIVLQEAFSDSHVDRILSGLANEYPYQTDVLGRDRALEQDGGVVIISKWPIERVFEKLYGDICNGGIFGGDGDCLADKGVLYTRININGGRFHIFGTHTDAGAGAGDQLARKQQFRLIKKLIDSMHIPSNQPVIISGDLNVNLYNTNAYRSMLEIFSASHPGPKAGARGFSSDSDRNKYVEDNHEYLDYVLISDDHLTPSTAFNDLLILKQGEQDLSDHFPVLGSFSFPNVAAVPTGTFPFAVFFQGNDVSQERICNVSMEVDKVLAFKGHHECDNDAVRSLTLYDIPAGRVLRLYDSPDGKREDDWIEIRAKRAISKKQISTFERSFEDDDIRVIYHRNNGLDGKVSRLEVSSAPSKATVDFFEGNNASQNLLCSVSPESIQTIKFKGHPECDNDEARSLVLYDIPAGLVLRLYANSDGKREDDWIEIRAKRAISKKQINTFERSFEDDDISVIYFRNNGLDGKVSRFEVTPSTGALRGVLSFYEGNNASQNKVCDLGTSSGIIRFKNNSQCDNDEARSLIMTSVKVGTVIRVYDDPACRTNDDWTEILATQNIARQWINTFERSSKNDSVRVTFHSNNGLDGKVSCVKVSVP